MSALTIRMPDEKYQRLKALSRRRRTSVNQLIDEMATLLLAEADAEAHFALRAARGKGKVERGLELLIVGRHRLVFHFLSQDSRSGCACRQTDGDIQWMHLPAFR